MTGRNPIANYVEPRGDAGCSEDATSVDYCCSNVDATNNFFFSLERARGCGVRLYTPKEMAEHSEKNP